MLATTPPKAMRTSVRTPGTFVRDISRAVQEALDSAVRRAPDGSVGQRLIRADCRMGQVFRLEAEALRQAN